MNRISRPMPHQMSQADLYRGEVNMGPPGLPPKELRCWSAGGTMTTGNQDKVVALQQPFPDPGAYTITFNLDPLQINLAVVGIRAQADIVWSVAGNSYKRTINVGDGTTISGVAEAVSVIVKDVTVAAGAPSAMTGFNYQVSIMVAPGTRPANPVPPTLSPFPFIDPINIIPLMSIAPAGIATIQIPKGIGVVSVHVDVSSALSSPGIIIPDQSAVVSQSSGGGPIRFYDPRAIDWCPIQPGSQAVNMFNFSAADTYIFSLVWGIDG